MQGISIERVIGFCNGILETLGINLWFLLSNLPLIVFFLFVGIDQVGNYIYFFAFCLLPLGPSLAALFYTMRRFMLEKDIKVCKTYLEGYKKNGRQSLALAGFQCLAIVLLAVNIHAFDRILPGFGFGFLFRVLLLLAVLLTPNLYMVQMHYEVKLTEVFKNALILLFGRPLCTLGNISAFLVVLILYQLLPGLVILVAGSLYAFLVLFMNRKWFI